MLAAHPQTASKAGNVLVIGNCLPSKAMQRLEESTNLLTPAQLAEADVIVVAGHDAIDKATIQGAPLLKGIVSITAGLDHIDTKACAERQIPVTHNGGAASETLASFAMTLIEASLRGVLHNRVPPSSMPHIDYSVMYGREAKGSTLGIVGMGNIGTLLAKSAYKAGMKVLYHNRSERIVDNKTDVTYEPLLDDLLANSDCVVSLLPLTKSTEKFFGPHQFHQMKPTAHFLNLSRGKIVDSDALTDALQQKEIAAAVLDVTDPEPLPPHHPLLTLAYVTPHLASATQNAADARGAITFENTIAILQNKPPKHVANGVIFPRVIRKRRAASGAIPLLRRFPVRSGPIRRRRAIA